MAFRILIDMDGALANFSAAVDERVVALGGEIADGARRGRFDIEQQYPDYAEELRAAMKQPGFYAGLRPIDGAIDGVRELEDAGLDPWICTAPVRSRYCAGEKLDWIVRHFDWEMAAKTIITKDKTVVAGDVLIDDKPQVTGADTPRWTHVLFDQPYNRHVIGPRIRSWTQPNLAAAVLAHAMAT